MKGLRLALLAGIVVMGLTAFGCGGDDGNDDGNECDPACAAGFTCTDGVCVEDVVECDPECTEGFVCFEGECVAEVIDCDPACEDGFTCVEGECVEDVVVDCDPACEDGFTCVEGECVEDVVVDCDPACEDGFTCVEGECVEDVVVECDPACEDGFTCIEGECVEDVIVAEIDTLLAYLEGDGGNYINDGAPKVIGLTDVLAEGLDTWTIIDVRTQDKYGPDDNGVWQMAPNGTPDYDDGHIDGAILVPLADIAAWAADNLTEDDMVLVTCHTGHLAGHAVLALNLLGYDAYALKFGMAAWHSDFDIWSGKTSNDYADLFIGEDAPAKPEAGDYPTLDTGETDGAAILDARVTEMLTAGGKFITIADLFAAPDDFFVINYWPEAEYLDPGHMAGSYQYTPLASMHTDADLATLPTDMPIVVYCYTGQHGSQVTAWLNILGYEAYDLKFGTNGMIYDLMTKKTWGGPDTPADMDYVGMVEKPEIMTLIEHLEGDNGDYINAAAPKVIGLTDVLAEGLENWTIIDIRTQDKYGPDSNGDWQKVPNLTPDFEEGHIDGAILVPLADIATWAAANLTEDDMVLVTCHTGHLAGHAVLALNLLGYDAYSLKFGMAAWHTDFDIWSSKTSNDYAGLFVTDAAPAKPEFQGYPEIDTGEADGPSILSARIDDMLTAGGKFITIVDLFSAVDDYYIVNYWPEAEYLDPGHIDSSYQYSPLSAMHTGMDLGSLPTDQPIVVYCYTGQHGSQVTAWLNILGYEAYDLKFGTNGMIYDLMTKKTWGGPDTPADMDYVTAE